MLRTNIHQCYCFHKNSTNSQEAWCRYEQDTRLGFHQKLRNLLHTLELFLKMHCYATISLCCYPNVNGSVRNLSQNTSTAPIFLLFNYFRENIWVKIQVQFHFLYIFVGRVERIYKTSHITMLSFYFFPSDLQSFGDELNRSSKMALQIFELMKIESKYLDISNCIFTMNCSTDKKIIFWSFSGRDFICRRKKAYQKHSH